MPRKRKKFWNEGGIPGLGPEVVPRPPAPPIPHVPLTPSTGLVFSPRFEEKKQPPAAPTEEKEPADAE